jgi:hypothetical protein
MLNTIYYKARFSNLLNVRQANLANAITAWKTYKAQTGDNSKFSDWFNTSTFFNQDQSYKKQVDAINAQQAAIIAALDGPLSATKAALTSAYTMSVTPPGGQPTNMPQTSLSGNLSQDIANWDTYPDDQYDFMVDMTSSDVTSSPWKTVISNQTTATCWSANTNLNIDSSRIITDNNYKTTVKFKGIASYQVQRGSWWNSTLVSPSRKLVQGSIYSSNDFFGPQGYLHLIPTLYLVVYKPSIIIQMSTNTFQQHIVNAVNASAGLLASPEVV